MAIRGELTLECDTPQCHAEQVLQAEDANIVHGKRGSLELELFAPDWIELEDGTLQCPDCRHAEERDEAYEKAAARARNNDFADTNGRDWT